MREADDAVAAEADDPEVDGGVEQPRRFRVDRREHRWGRPFGCRGHREQAADLLRLLGDARLDELL